jgi:hypothetical protein
MNADAPVGRDGVVRGQKTKENPNDQGSHEGKDTKDFSTANGRE